MIQRVFYGNTNSLTEAAKDIRINEKMILALIVVVIIALGVYPKPFLELTQSSVDSILPRMFIKPQ